MNPVVERVRALLCERVLRHPGNPAYGAAFLQLQVIDNRLQSGVAPDRAFYESLTHGIGLMCARELEASDVAFCDAVYAMLEEIRKQAVG